MKEKKSSKNAASPSSAVSLEQVISCLESISRTLAVSREAEPALRALVSVIRHLTGARQAAGYLFDPGRRCLVPAITFGFPGAGAELTSLEELIGHLAGLRDGQDTGLMILSRISPSSPAWRFIEQNRQALDTLEAVLLLPLHVGCNLYGSIVLGKLEGGREYRSHELELLDLAGKQISLGLEHYFHAESLKKSSFQHKLKVLELETLQDVGAAISSILDMNRLTEELLLRAVSVMNVNRALVLLTPSAGSSIAPSRKKGKPSRMILASAFGLDEVDPALLTSFGGSELIARNLDRNAPTVINDPKKVPGALGFKKLLVVPIQFKGELLGAIMIGDKEGRHGEYPDFNEDDVGLLGAMANQAGAAVSNARLYHDVLEIKNYNENILSSIASGVITTDSKGRIVSYNESAAMIFGIPSSRAVGLGIDKLFAMVGMPELADSLRPTLAEGTVFQETNLPGHAGGRKLVLNVSATALVADKESGATTGMVISVENISEGVRVKEMLKRYVSSNVVDLALEEGHELVLGGQEREVTILFSDIRGFTPLSEERTPQQVVELLNSYFDLMIDVAFRFNGTVDKIVGDEIMVLFGAPFSFEDDTQRAVGCALAMLEALEGFNSQRQAEGQIPIGIGIGINRGQVISGNIGSTKHMDYTVIGDAVNLASRLVSHAHGGQILVSRSVYEAIGDNIFICRPVESLRVKGKRDPVEVFEILGTAQPSNKKK